MQDIAEIALVLALGAVFWGLFELDATLGTIVLGAFALWVLSGYSKFSAIHKDVSDS